MKMGAGGPTSQASGFLPPLRGSSGWGFYPGFRLSAPPRAIFLPPLRGSSRLRLRRAQTKYPILSKRDFRKSPLRAGYNY